MARNRMIRPEFWEDTIMSELSPLTRLFYIALWNFADDEGYIKNNHKWLKIKCLPYDKVDISELIKELVNHDRIAISGEVIFIKNFTKYQKINKPQPSTLSQEFKDSRNVHGMVRECERTKREEEEEIEEEEEEEEEMCKEDFARFWEIYPNKKNRKKAEEKFLKLNNSLLPEILSSLQKQIQCEAWARDGGKFIPHPTTWLNGERWKDDIEIRINPITTLPDGTHTDGTYEFD